MLAPQAWRAQAGAFAADDPMANEKKAYPLRISASVLDAMQRWSNDELRSLNAQIEYVLREALRKSGRLTPNPQHERSKD